MLVLTSNHRYQGDYKNMHKTGRMVEMRSSQLLRECFKNLANGHRIWNKDDAPPVAPPPKKMQGQDQFIFL